MKKYRNRIKRTRRNRLLRTVGTLLIAGYSLLELMPGQTMSIKESSALERKVETRQIQNNQLNSYTPKIKFDFNEDEKQELKLVINQKFIDNIIYIESKNNPRAVSKKGAKGVMQLKKIAWDDVENVFDYNKWVFDPIINKMVGKKYLWKLEEYCKKYHPKWDNLNLNEKRDCIAAGYNLGPTRLKKISWNIPKAPEETQLYVKELRRLNPIID